MHGFARNGGLSPWGDIESLPTYRIETYATAPGEYVMALEGELDLASRSELDAELERLEDQRPRRVVADLTAATFVDVATLGLLEAAHERLHACRAELRLVCSDCHTLKILKLTGLDLVLDVFDTIAQALSSRAYPANVVWLPHAAGG
jgi:anti-sigma B factor antagonist